MTCQGSNGALSELLGSFHLSLKQQSQSQIDLQLYSSSYASFDSLTVHCTYRQCHLMSGADCSSYLSGFNNCIECLDFSCSINLFDQLRLYETDNITFPVEEDSDPGILYYQYNPILNPIIFLFTSQTLKQSSIFGCHSEGDCSWIHVQIGSVFVI